jgi:hypothetical protein
MKWTLTLALLLVVGAGTGMAAVINFTVLDDGLFVSAPIGWTATVGTGYFNAALGDVQFLYDDFENPALNGTAVITSHGIDGFAGTGNAAPYSPPLGGALEFTFGPLGFPTPVTGGLVFNFTLWSGGDPFVPLSVADGAFACLDNELFDCVTVPTVGGAGTVSFLSPSGPYSRVATFFTLDPSATKFNVSSLSFDIQPGDGGVPEPGTYVLLASGGLFLMGFRRLLKRRS